MAGNVHVILARDVPNLGRVGDLAQVRPGYARNYLIPQGLALPASPKRVAEFEHKKRIIEHKRRILRAGSEKRAEELAKVQVTVTAKVGEQGKLFGSITNRDISNALKADGHDIHHRDIKLDGPLKSIGLHVIDLRLEADVTAQIKVIVAAEEVPEEEPEEDEVEDESFDADSYDAEADAFESNEPVEASPED
jgi:large subunit ribosomal protein L9